MDLFVRPGTTDVDVVWQLFVHNDDEFLYDINWTPSTILDAGGNVGIATILFAHLFPEATIVVIEPVRTLVSKPGFFWGGGGIYWKKRECAASGWNAPVEFELLETRIYPKLSGVYWNPPTSRYCI